MNDQLPDFEWPADPVTEAPKPKKPRRKPTKKRAVRAVPAPAPKREAPKRNSKAFRKGMVRRGRPAGSLNKPKTVVLGTVVPDVNALLIAYAAVIRALEGLSPGARRTVLSNVLAELAK